MHLLKEKCQYCWAPWQTDARPTDTWPTQTLGPTLGQHRHLDGHLANTDTWTDTWPTQTLEQTLGQHRHLDEHLAITDTWTDTWPTKTLGRTLGLTLGQTLVYETY